MEINLDDLIVDFQSEMSESLTDDWTWLIGTDKKVILISIIGDMFLANQNGSIFWLDVGQGKVEMVADDQTEFERKLTDVEQVNEWFMIDLSSQLLSGMKLKPGELYSYKQLPILGGDYVTENFEPTSMAVHFSFAGQIHNQIKDLPEGTRVNEVKFTKG
jgi:hypothetical protein